MYINVTDTKSNQFFLGMHNHFVNILIIRVLWFWIIYFLIKILYWDTYGFYNVLMDLLVAAF